VRAHYFSVNFALKLLRPLVHLTVPTVTHTTTYCYCCILLFSAENRAVVEDVCSALAIPADGIRVGSWDRPNLSVTVQRVPAEDGKRKALRELMAAPAFSKGACIIYVWRQVSTRS
jgi:superfamily II DNA helicase RecQ